MELYPEPFSLKTAADEVCTIMRPIATKRYITITIDSPPAAATVNLDLRKFKQVLYNLLSNVVKFSHEEGVVKLTIALDAEDRLHIQVKDSGIGIKDDDLPRIFREFEQLSQLPDAFREPGSVWPSPNCRASQRLDQRSKPIRQGLDLQHHDASFRVALGKADSRDA